MYIRMLHHYAGEACPLYKGVSDPILWAGRQVVSPLPEVVKTGADRVAYAVEILLPRVGIILGAAAAAFYSGRPEAAWGVIAGLVWLSYDLADAIQFYPYDYLEDLTSPAFEKEKASIIIRPELLERVAFYISKPPGDNNNVLTIGPPGCGKTSAALALVRLIESPECPPDLKDKKVYRVRLDKLMANVQRPGDFEMRFLALLNTVLLYNKDTILFIDEAHQLLDKRGNGSTSLANLLKPFLSIGLHCLAATTKKEYEKQILEDEAFEQRFNIVEMPALEEETCILILQKKFPGLAATAAKTAMVAAKELYPRNALPRSAILLLENTRHRTKATPTVATLHAQVAFERDSLGSLIHSTPAVASAV
jgi:ATP-dependent Clp protease ATP-binding subunit ClpA